MTLAAPHVSRSLGVVYVQPEEDAPPALTLFVHDKDTSQQRIGHPSGIELFDHSGTAVSPNSNRLGYHGRRGTQVCDLVCDDDVSDETMQRLVSAGYRRVIRRG